jgi:hypothetical protein
VVKARHRRSFNEVNREIVVDYNRLAPHKR